MMMATLAVAASTVVGVGAAGGTFALLTANAQLPGATVRAGTLTLKINDGDQAALGAWNLGPTVAQAKPFTITNTGTVATSINASGVVTSTTPLGAHVNARLTALNAGESCAPGLGGSLKDLPGFAVTGVTSLPAGATADFCLELTLDTNTPGQYSGQSVDFAITITGVQRGS